MSTSPSGPARSMRCSARTAPANRRWSRSSTARCSRRAGEIRWNGQPVDIANPAAARRLGIGMVFQHFSLFEALTVAENIALALAGTPASAALQATDPHGLGANTACRSIPDAVVADLSVGERQRVEIVRCLLQEPRAHHHGRADLGADAAGGRRPVRDAEAARLGGRARSSTSATGWRRCARSATTPRSCATARWSPTAIRRRRRAKRLARLMVGAEVRERRAAPSRRRRTAPVAPGGAATCRCRSRIPSPSPRRRSTSTCGRARSSASPASPATARTSSSTRSPASGSRRATRTIRHRRQAVSAGAASTRAAGSARPSCRRSGSATAPCRGFRCPRTSC